MEYLERDEETSTYWRFKGIVSHENVKPGDKTYKGSSINVLMEWENGHLDRVKRIFGYLAKMQHSCIRFMTDEPDFSDVPIPVYDWASTIYGDSKEMIPLDTPIPLGKAVVTSHYTDASLHHDVLTGKAVTAILHFVNQTPIDWYSKKQSTVETATYGSEFVAARTCVDQIVDLRNTLRYMGIPVREKSFMFGDNESVVNSSTCPEGKLHKRHIMLSFHRVREAIASGMIVFTFIPGSMNPADILSKHWSYAKVCVKQRSDLRNKDMFYIVNPKRTTNDGLYVNIVADRNTISSVASL